MRITTIGRANKIVYGTNATFSFDIRFSTNQYTKIAGSNPDWYTPSTVNNTSAPTPGTIIVAGVTVFLTAVDIKSPQAVANKITSTLIQNSQQTGFTILGDGGQGIYDVGVGTILVPSKVVTLMGGTGMVLFAQGGVPLGSSGINYGAFLSPYQSDLITLVSTTIGPIPQPTVTLGTATNIFFQDITFINGSSILTVGAQDDIVVRGRTPITVTVGYTGGTQPSVQASYGTDLEQAQGALTYQTAISLVGNTYTFTNPINYLRLTTQALNTQAILYITR
jgi:hypothetical protein